MSRANCAFFIFSGAKKVLFANNITRQTESFKHYLKNLYISGAFLLAFPYNLCYNEKNTERNARNEKISNDSLKSGGFFYIQTVKSDYNVARNGRVLT